MRIRTSEQEELELGIGGYSCNWGIHMCGLYETAEERDEILSRFLGMGAVAGDLQLLAADKLCCDAFENAFLRRFPDQRATLEDPRYFQKKESRELYFPEGRFSVEAMDRTLNDFYEGSQQDGKRNVRATAEMGWALESMPGIEHFMAYESRLNLFIEGKPWISICLFDLNRFSGNMMMQVLQTHPYTLIKGVMMQNPYYRDPHDWLEQNAPEYAPGRGQAG